MGPTSPDLEKLSNFNLPSTAKFKLSDICIPILENCNSKSRQLLTFQITWKHGGYPSPFDTFFPLPNYSTAVLYLLKTSDRAFISTSLSICRLDLGLHECKIR